jgi:hypothetical protein
VSNPYEWETTRYHAAFCYAEGYWDLAKTLGFSVPVVDSAEFAREAVKRRIESTDFRRLYERMARGETTQTDLPNAA